MNDDRSLVYVVDDDASVRTALSRLLRSIGVEVQAFPSATEFLEFVRPERPSCVVLDVRMPRLSGLELQQALAARGPSLPIIFVSGHADVPMSVRAMKAGAVDFLPKPFHDQDLIDAVQKALVTDRENRARSAELATLRRVYEKLTPREREVLAHVVSGALNKQIAATLGTSEKTIKVHRGRIMEKMGAESLADLVRLAARLGVQGPGAA